MHISKRVGYMWPTLVWEDSQWVYFRITGRHLTLPIVGVTRTIDIVPVARRYCRPNDDPDDIFAFFGVGEPIYSEYLEDEFFTFERRPKER